MPESKTIVTPTDYSEASIAAVRFASDMAKSLGAKLIVLHVIEPNVQVSDLAWVGVDQRLLESDTRDVAEARMKQLIQETVAPGVATETVVLAGGAVRKIVDYAKKADADFIVLGTQGHSRVGHLILGSVTESVMKKAHCQVVAVRDPAALEAHTDAEAGAAD